MTGRYTHDREGHGGIHMTGRYTHADQMKSYVVLGDMRGPHVPSVAGWRILSVQGRQNSFFKYDECHGFVVIAYFNHFKFKFIYKTVFNALHKTLLRVFWKITYSCAYRRKRNMNVEIV